MKPYSLVRAFKPKDAFGEPRVYLKKMAMDGNGEVVDGQVHVLGTVFGKAEAITQIKRTGARGDVEFFYGIQGAVEAIPTDPEKNPQRSNIAWLPTHIHDEISGLLADRYDERTHEPKTNPEGAEIVSYAFEVSIKSSRKSSAGFVWEFNSLIEVERGTADPLADIRSKLPGQTITQHVPLIAKGEEEMAVEDISMDEARGEEPDNTGKMANQAANEHAPVEAHKIKGATKVK